MKIEEMHRLAELIRFRYGIAPPPEEEARSLIRLGSAIWEGREQLFRPHASGDEQPFDERTRRDLMDLIVLWADLRGRYPRGGEGSEGTREVLRVLTQAETLLGSSPSLERQRRACARGSGLEEALPTIAFEPRSAWEHFELGKSYMRSGDLVPASREFHAGLLIRPQDFWLNYYEGLCAYRLKHFEEAVGAFQGIHRPLTRCRRVSLQPGIGVPGCLGGWMRP